MNADKKTGTSFGGEGGKGTVAPNNLEKNYIAHAPLISRRRPLSLPNKNAGTKPLQIDTEHLDLSPAGTNNNSYRDFHKLT